MPAKATRYNYYTFELPPPPDQIFADGFECGDTSAWSEVSGGGRCTSDGAGTTRTVSPTYTRGLLTAVPGYAGAITYRPSGLVDAITHANGVVVTYGVDPDAMARPASITAKKGTSTLWSTGAYSYDGAGNVTTIGGSYFLYDAVSRLTTGTVSTSSSGTGSLATQTYAYDAFGNIQSIGGSPGRSTPTDSATNRLTGTAVYDASGNLTSWNGNSYEYDALNMMTRMTSGAEDWLYVYTADDERVWQFKLAFGPPFHRYTLRDLSGQVLREYISVADFWTVERDYIYRGGQLLAAQTPAGVRHFHLDHLWTPRSITNGSGQSVAYHVYYPFGEEATSPFQDAERLKFTGHERDLADTSGTGDDLDYMHARHCSPLTARFMSVDPIGGEPTVPQSWNRYSYARNRPLVLVDPDGEIIGIVLALGVGAILLGPSPANAPESPETELLPNEGDVPYDVLATEAALGPVGEWVGGFFGKLFGKWFGKGAKVADDALEGANGEIHHVISRRIHRALEEHPNLAGEYAARDARLTVRAADEAAHRGYQTWHRKLDNEVIDWLRANPEATAREFESFLRSRYSASDLLERFPEGLE